MSTYDLSFTIREIRTAHLAFPDTPGYWEQYRRQNEARSATPSQARYEFKSGWQTVYATMVETPLVRVELVDLYTGWGESNTPVAPEIVCLMLDAAISEMVLNREFESPTALWDFVYDSQRGRGVNSGYWMDALAALDIAIWDALGKRNHAPVAALLGDDYRTNIPVYLSGLRRATLDERITQAKSLADQGIRGAKIFQSGDIPAALQELDALIHGAPDVEQWMVDTLWMCNLNDAITAKTRIRPPQPPLLRVPAPTRRPRRTSLTASRRRFTHRNRRTLPHDLPTQRLADTRTNLRHLPTRHRPNQHQRLHPPTRPRNERPRPYDAAHG